MIWRQVVIEGKKLMAFLNPIQLFRGYGIWMGCPALASPFPTRADNDNTLPT
jgi:hypothetical protein